MATQQVAVQVRVGQQIERLQWVGEGEEAIQQTVVETIYVTVIEWIEVEVPEPPSEDQIAALQRLAQENTSIDPETGGLAFDEEGFSEAVREEPLLNGDLADQGHQRLTVTPEAVARLGADIESLDNAPASPITSADGLDPTVGGYSGPAVDENHLFGNAGFGNIYDPETGATGKTAVQSVIELVGGEGEPLDNCMDAAVAMAVTSGGDLVIDGAHALVEIEGTLYDPITGLEHTEPLSGSEQVIPNETLDEMFAAASAAIENGEDPLQATIMAGGGPDSVAATVRANEVKEISDEELTGIMNGAIVTANLYAEDGAGATAQHTMNYLVQAFAANPAFQEPPGSGNVDWPSVLDYSMAVASHIFVGGDTVQSGLSRVGAGGSQLSQVLDTLPPVPTDAIPGGDLAAWRSSLNPPDASLRPDFQDGSNGQLRHGWVYLAIGYATGDQSFAGAAPRVIGAWGHEAWEDGTRQDFAMAMACFVEGQALWGARSAAGAGYDEGANVAANWGMHIYGFFAGSFGAESSVTFPSPDGDVTLTAPTEWSMGSGVSGSTVAITALTQIAMNDITWNMMQNLPWASPDDDWRGSSAQSYFVTQGWLSP